MSADRGAWVQVVDGELTVNGEALKAGDGVAISGADDVRLEARAATEALLFDMGP
jgi:quercetin 2,3-dioxygenase